MDFGVGEMGFIFCGKHPHLVTSTQVSNPGPKDPLVLIPTSVQNFRTFTIDMKCM